MRRKWQERNFWIANALLVLFFFLGGFGGWEWITWFILLLLACSVDISSTYACYVKDNFSTKNETNWLIRRAKNSMDTAWSGGFYPLIIIGASGFALDYIIHPFGKLLIFILVVWKTETAVSNLVLVFDKKVRTIFAPEPR